MRLGRNLAAGLASSISTTLLGLAVVPLYLRYLGIEAYGLIGLFATLQALLAVLDLGLAPTINREVARYAASGDVRQVGPLLHTLAVVYWGMALAIGLAFALGAPLLAERWLRPGQLSPPTVTAAVALMGAIAACRWPAGLYLGALMGSERLVTASALGFGAAALSSLGGVAVVAFISPTVQAFFVWQAIAGLGFALATRWAAWAAVGRAPGLRFDRTELRRVWRFSAGMSGLALYTVLFTQLDKVVLSRLLPLDQLGRYALATTVASGLYLIATPIFNVFYPRFSALVASGEERRLTELYRRGTRLLGAGVFPAAMLLTVFGQDLVRVWTGDAALALAVAPLVGILAVGSALHAVMFLPYALQLAHGQTRLALQINAILAVAVVPLLVGLALRYGALGGAMAWLVLHLLYLALGTWMTHRRLLRGLGLLWITSDVAAPLAVSLVLGLVGWNGLEVLAASPWARLAFGAGLAAAAGASSLAMSRDLRSLARDWLAARRREPQHVEPR